MTTLPDILDGDVMRWVSGAAIAGAISLAGRRSSSLTTSGALSATAVGGIIVGAGGWWTGALLVAFFVTSSALSRTHTAATPGVDPVWLVQQARGHQRDAVQVIANGGIPACFAIIGWLASDSEPWHIASAAGIAAATADTWATEIGRRGNRQPRSIVSWRPMVTGSSGAISALGTAGSGAGALLIAALASAGTEAGVWVSATAAGVFVVILIAGFAGSLLDSVLGATVQGRWWCPSCEADTESAVHHCGGQAQPRHGVSLIDNDVVNAVSIAGAGSIGLVLAMSWV